MPEPPNPGGGPGWGVAEESLGKGRRRGRDPMGAHWAAAKRWGADGGVGLQTALSAPWGEGGVSPTVVLMVVMLRTPPAAPHRLSAVRGAPTDGPLCSDPTNPTAQPPGAQHSTPTPPQTWGALPALQPPHPPMPREQQNYLILSGGGGMGARRDGRAPRAAPACPTSVGQRYLWGEQPKAVALPCLGANPCAPPSAPPLGELLPYSAVSSPLKDWGCFGEGNGGGGGGSPRFHGPSVGLRCPHPVPDPQRRVGFCGFSSAVGAHP